MYYLVNYDIYKADASIIEISIEHHCNPFSDLTSRTLLQHIHLSITALLSFHCINENQYQHR